MSWATEEMAQVALGDKRLNRRAATLLEMLSAHPDQSIPAKAKDWAEMMAAYRFFDNDRVDEQKLLEPHRLQTIERMRAHEVVLCLEDTTQIDQTTHRATTGLGPLYQPYQRGMFLHPMLAVTPAGIALGVLGAKFYAREEDAVKLTPGEKADRLIEEKESFRWLDGYRSMNALARERASQLIYVADRESDFEELLAEAQGQPGHLLIRARHDRFLENNERMWDTVWTSPVVGEQTFEMKARPGRLARMVQQTLRAKKITLPETDKREKAITITVVIAHEENPPPGEESVSWTLLTTLPVSSAQDVMRIVDYYRSRWSIEEYFKILKSGCKIEQLQLETAERLKSAIALCMITAYRILWMTKVGRETPDIPCDAVFEDEEWKVAYRYETGTVMPKIVPRLIEIIMIIAKMGGFPGRKSDGFPGAKTLWIGLGTIRGHLAILARFAENEAARLKVT